jgi:DNA polymerase/3'-5' exonuclease PolX
LSIVCKKKLTHDNDDNSSNNFPFSSNLKISEVFKKLGNLHQECPLLPVDNWKAYCFRVVAGCLQNLDYEISHDTLDRLAGIKGIGTSSLDKIREYLDTGKLSRIEEFQTDPKRIAMKQMMDIWGVGRIKVSPLNIRKPFTSSEAKRFQRS